MGASENVCTIRPLVAALCFHQLFEGMGLGGCILQVRIINSLLVQKNQPSVYLFVIASNTSMSWAAAGGVRDEDERHPGLLLRGDHPVRSRPRHRAVQHLQRQQPDGAHRGGAAERRLRGAAQLHGHGGSPGQRLHGAKATRQLQASTLGLRSGAVGRRRHVSHGQMGLKRACLLTSSIHACVLLSLGILNRLHKSLCILFLSFFFSVMSSY